MCTERGALILRVGLQLIPAGECNVREFALACVPRHIHRLLATIAAGCSTTIGQVDLLWQVDGA